MGRPIIINEAVWPNPGHLMIVLPDEENMSKLMEAKFEFRLNNLMFSKGDVKDFLSNDRSLGPKAMLDNHEHVVYLDIFEPPGLSLQERKSLPERTTLFDPLRKNAVCTLLVFFGGETTEIQTTRHSRRTRECHDLEEN